MAQCSEFTRFLNKSWQHKRHHSKATSEKPKDHVSISNDILYQSIQQPFNQSFNRPIINQSNDLSILGSHVRGVKPKMLDFLTFLICSKHYVSSFQNWLISHLIFGERNSFGDLLGFCLIFDYILLEICWRFAGDLFCFRINTQEICFKFALYLLLLDCFKFAGDLLIICFIR